MASPLRFSAKVRHNSFIGARIALKRFVIAGFGVLVIGLLIAAVGIAHFPLSALPEPGRLETALADKAKHHLVHRSSREGVPPAPADREASAKEGEQLFGTECGACHGNSGHNPTDAGRWMYPRAADLTAVNAQSYSDRELFWIIKNGIRLSGMPAFGKVESDEHIWDLVFFVRALPKPASANK
jgi:mono/diheme cytochrome c family protein